MRTKNEQNAKHKKQNTNNGITLIALIITIIIMLILVAVTITVAVNGGLFEYAGRAGTKTNEAKDLEQNYVDLAEGLSYEDLIGIYSSELNPKGTIPIGCHYTPFGGTTLNPGQSFPTTLNKGDKYETTDYVYIYKQYYDSGDEEWYDFDNDTPDGWSVMAINNKAKYEPILYSINGEKINVMYRTFEHCTLLQTAPAIPNNVIDMNCTFIGCISLQTAPAIPNNVIDMGGTFYGCTSLQTAPAIPNNVINMLNAFFGCTSLQTAPAIPKSVTNMSGTFESCASITGTISIPCHINISSYNNCPATIEIYHYEGCGH